MEGNNNGIYELPELTKFLSSEEQMFKSLSREFSSGSMSDYSAAHNELASKISQIEADLVSLGLQVGAIKESGTFREKLFQALSLRLYKSKNQKMNEKFNHLLRAYYNQIDQIDKLNREEGLYK